MYGKPIKTSSFYEVYRDGYADSNNTSSPDPGGASGGFCAVGVRRPGWRSGLGALAVLGLGAAARLRRAAGAGKAADDRPALGGWRCWPAPRSPRSPSRPARAQDFASEAAIVEGEGNRFRSPQRFAFELTFGPYRPDVDSEFNGRRDPYNQFFGGGHELLMRGELDYQFFHRYGSLGVGLGAGYFSVTGRSPVADGIGPASAATTRR